MNPAPRGSSRLRIGAAALIAAAGLVVYANSYFGPFVFDDFASIPDNPTIRHLWPLTGPLSPPSASGVGGRPFLNLSYAVNYALGQLRVEGYHATNLLIHLLAGLVLFGIVQRTWRRSHPELAGAGERETACAFAIALLWTVHPLQTASVTYLSQRAESLAGLCYLLTLYGFVRYVETPSAAAGRRLWAGLAIAAGCSGMATKEGVATAPLMVLLYDRTWVAGSFREAWQRRRPLYLALAAPWLMLGALVLHTRPEARGLGFGTGIPWGTYALTEAEVVIRYLGLAFWPHPLVLDYDQSAAAGFWAAAPWLLLVGSLLAATLIALRRWPALGFLGAWFFVLLAPSSSVMPVSGEVMAENRMYLPLAAVIALGVCAVQAAVGRRGWLLCLPVAVALGGLTWERNAEYRNVRELWARTVAQRPDNPRARYEWANALLQDGLPAEAMGQYAAALRLNSGLAEAWDGLGVALARGGRWAEAIADEQAAVRLRPSYPNFEYNLGYVLAQAGRAAEAIAPYEAALRAQPIFPAAEENLGSAYLSLGNPALAVTHYQVSLRQRPGDADTHYNLGLALRALGRTAEAQAEFAAAERLGAALR